MTRSSTCHPEREHYAKGLCNACYMVDFRKSHPRWRDYYKEYASSWRKSNPGYQAPSDKRTAASRRSIQRKSDLKRRYGLSVEQFNEMCERQNNRCLICTDEFSGTVHTQMACVDHDHSTEEVRGILCRACNVALGYFKDDPAVIMRAVKYLKEQ